MKKYMIIPLLYFFVTSLFAQDKAIVVEPTWLNDHLKDANLIVLQVSSLKFDYDNGHIAGAHYLWPESLAPNSPEGNFNVPDLKVATELLQKLGINQNSHVVICHVHSDVSISARMFLTLEHLGLHGQVSFLNGGLNAWKKAGYPVTKDVVVVKRGNFKPTAGALIVNKDYVVKNLHSPNSIVVDARMQRFYDGEPVGYPRDGHIAGAKNIPYTEMLNAQNRFKSLDSLQTYFTPVATKEKELVTYCFIGQTASVVYIAGRLLGYEMKLYDGSMQEWSRLEELPMEK